MRCQEIPGTAWKSMNAYKQSLYRGIIRILANVFMVGAIFLAMRQASRPGLWASETIFCLYFFGITIPVWILAVWLCKKVQKIYPAEKLTLITLPRQGECLVRWSVGTKCTLAENAVFIRKPINYLSV